MNMIFVKPNKEARVRQPERSSAVMAPSGDWVSRTVYYEALIASGDAIVVDPQPEFPTASKSEPASPAPPAPSASTGQHKAK